METTITAKINPRPNGYGFGYDWDLRIEKNGIPKVFMLGQDVKVCHRCLGAQPSDVINHIGGNDLSDPKVNQKLVNLILREYAQHEDEPWEETAEAIYDSVEPWHLAVE